jgi:Heterokaryon incompatibility protein (HET)
MKNHKSCESTLEDRRPPKRLLSVGDETQDLKLIEIASNSRNIEWAALSYCWGVEPSLKLNMRTMSKLKDGVSVGTLDATIMDAILVTRALGLSYIWIDALCVNQEKGVKEWEEEAARMNDIYGGSTVTLVAASSPSTMHGFLKEREVQYIPIPIGHKSSAKVFLSSEWMSDYDEISSSWGKRGWTMQEGLLPNRILYYTPSQMVWRCCEERRTERGTTKSLQNEVDEDMKHGDDVPFEFEWLWRQDSFIQFKMFPKFVANDSKYISGLSRELFRLWYQLIKSYSPRQFTEEKDRLIAISGLARMVGKAIKDYGYAAGLWKSDLIRGLLWYAEDAKLVPSKPAHDNLPSWSWASVGDQLINHVLSNDDQYTAVSRIEDVHVDLVDPLEPFGSATGGRITITGPFKRLSRLYYEQWKLPEAPLSRLERHLSKLIAKQSLKHVESKYMTPSGGRFAALQMASCGDALHILLLEAAGGINDGNGVYCRVGICTLRHFYEADVAAPELVRMMEESSNSLAARLGPPQMPLDWQDLGSEVYEELETQPWDKETVFLV